MSPFIFKLPRELWSMIVDQLSYIGLIRFSGTCKLCREKLAPKIFHTIRFKNSKRVAESALAAAKRFGAHTRCLKFVYYAEPEELNSLGELPLLTAPVLLPASRELLAGHEFQNLQTITFVFEFRLSRQDDNILDRRPDLFSNVEHIVETVDAEERHQWRALLNETYSAISENMTITGIVIQDLIPINVSAFYSRNFRQLLGRLTSAQIKLCWPSGYGRLDDVSLLLGYREFVTKMPVTFFCHMNQLQELDLYVDGVPLEAGPATALALALVPKSLPALRSLKLTNFFICTNLLHFIKSKKSTLSRILLEDCVSDCDRITQPDSRTETWARFFTELRKLRLPLLVQFSVNYSIEGQILLDVYDLYDWADTDDTTDADDLMELIRTTPGRRLFSYGSLCRNGNLVVDRVVNRRHAWLSKDSHAYRRLQRSIRNNVARLACETLRSPS
ncbi:hypothetical protein V2A60_001835 [Cordyceps javanica]|uniref:F-box domain-containing protein n=1 Tax=Cordyceps javanica TaxID=43265 RepID=A0A545VGD9_9HYPO|nr:hypothetical protein IF1G_00725 [Cordyceps javanica]TQW11973.1 f-box domain-containing protein [Cordyceps javanica]